MTERFWNWLIFLLFIVIAVLTTILLTRPAQGAPLKAELLNFHVCRLPFAMPFRF